MSQKKKKTCYKSKTDDLFALIKSLSLIQNANVK